MYSVLLIVHIMITLALIVVILVQRSASDGLGLSGSSSNSFMSGRTAASFVTRLTGILGGAFIITSLALGVITAQNHISTSSIVDSIDTTKTAKPAAVTAPAKPVKPSPATNVPRPE